MSVTTGTRYSRLLIALVSALAVITLAGDIQAAEPETFCKPNDLRCETQRSPMGVDAVKPRLSWKLDDTRRGARQTAYRVLVASTSAKLAADEGDLWDSGKSAVEQSHLIEYGGKPLASGQIVQWKVKVWDKDGAESPWSGPAHWEMGLLKPEDWKGKAITATSAGAIHDPDWMDYIILPKAPEGMTQDRKTIEKSILPVNLYGKDFTLEEVPERARLYATAYNNSYFAVYLNGQRIGDEERTPVPTFNGPKVAYYSVYDITPMLRKGENRLRCINWSDSRWSSGRAFYMQINGVTKGESSVLVATDATWRHRPSPYVAVGQGTIFEYYDFRIPDPTLAREGVSGPDWSPVTERRDKSTFVRSIMPAERVIRRVTPVEIWSPAPGVYTFDMGEIITGNIEWKVPRDLPAGSRIIFRESCFLQRDDAPMRYDSRSGGTKGDQGGKLYYPPHIDFSDTSKRIVHYWPQNLAGMMPSVFYVVGENPPATWRTILDNRVFRYVEIIGLNHPPKVEDLTGLMIHTDLPAVGLFESSEPDFNRFHNMCINTYLMNTHGLSTDCWDRERTPWNGNWPKNQFARYVYDIDPAIRNHTLENIGMVRKQGFCGMISRAGGEETIWSGSLVYLPQTAYLFGGDPHVVRESFEGVQKQVLHYRGRLGSNGLVRGKALFGDWLNYRHHHVADWLKKQPKSIQTLHKASFRDAVSARELSLLSSAVTCDMAGIAAGWATAVGRKEESLELRHFHDTLKATIHTASFNSEERSYGRFPEIMPLGEDTLDAWALVTGIPPTEEMRRDIMQKMIRELRERGHQFTTGIITSLSYFRLLADYGYADDAYAVYTREEPPSIKYAMDHLSQSHSINENLHITKRAAFRGGSPCHADFAQLADWFWYGLGGLRPDDAHPGLKHFTLAPQIPGKMAWAKIAHESRYGTIVSSWTRAGDQIRWEVTVPPNSTATALIPTTDAASIRERGKTIAQAGLTATAGPCETSRIELLPGAYVFEFQRRNQTQPANP